MNICSFTWKKWGKLGLWCLMTLMSCGQFLLVEETGENHWPAASHLSNNVASSTPHHERDLVVIGTDCIDNWKFLNTDCIWSEINNARPLPNGNINKIDIESLRQNLNLKINFRNEKCSYIDGGQYLQTHQNKALIILTFLCDSSTQILVG